LQSGYSKLIIKQIVLLLSEPGFKRSCGWHENITGNQKNNANIHLIMHSSQEKYSVALQTIKKDAEQYVIKDESAFEEIAKLVNEIT
jgi:hypothetical protein